MSRRVETVSETMVDAVKFLTAASVAFTRLATICDAVSKKVALSVAVSMPPLTPNEGTVSADPNDADVTDSAPMLADAAVTFSTVAVDADTAAAISKPTEAAFTVIDPVTDKPPVVAAPAIKVPVETEFPVIAFDATPSAVNCVVDTEVPVIAPATRDVADTEMPVRVPAVIPTAPTRPANIDVPEMTPLAVNGPVEMPDANIPVAVSDPADTPVAVRDPIDAPVADTVFPVKAPASVNDPVVRAPAEIPDAVRVPVEIPDVDKAPAATPDAVRVPVEIPGVVRAPTEIPDAVRVPVVIPDVDNAPATTSDAINDPVETDPPDIPEAMSTPVDTDVLDIPAAAVSAPATESEPVVLMCAAAKSVVTLRCGGTTSVVPPDPGGTLVSTAEQPSPFALHCCTLPATCNGPLSVIAPPPSYDSGPRSTTAPVPGLATTAFAIVNSTLARHTSRKATIASAARPMTVPHTPNASAQRPAVPRRARGA